MNTLDDLERKKARLRFEFIPWEPVLKITGAVLVIVSVPVLVIGEPEIDIPVPASGFHGHRYPPDRI